MAKRIIAGIAFLSVLAAVGLSGQDEAVPSLKDVEPFAYCSISHKGPLSDMPGVIGQLIQEMQGQNLFSSIRGPMIGIYYDALTPAAPADISWEMGFIVSAQAEPRAPLMKKVWDHATVASIVHTGPYDRVGATIEKLVAWVGTQGYVDDGPLMERYLNNPTQVKPEELQTEVWLPVRKK